MRNFGTSRSPCQGKRKRGKGFAGPEIGRKARWLALKFEGSKLMIVQTSAYEAELRGGRILHKQTWKPIYSPSAKRAVGFHPTLGRVIAQECTASLKRSLHIAELKHRVWKYRPTFKLQTLISLELAASRNHGVLL